MAHSSICVVVRQGKWSKVTTEDEALTTNNYKAFTIYREEDVGYHNDGRRCL